MRLEKVIARTIKKLPLDVSATTLRLVLLIPTGVCFPCRLPNVVFLVPPLHLQPKTEHVPPPISLIVRRTHTQHTDWNTCVIH